MEKIKTHNDKRQESANRSVANYSPVREAPEKNIQPITDNRASTNIQRQLIHRVRTQQTVIQRVVIQLKKGDNVEASIVALEELPIKALEFIGEDRFEYPKALEKYKELKDAVKKIYEISESPPREVEDQVTRDQSERSLKALKGLIASFKSTAEGQLTALVLEFNEINNKYATDIHNLTDQIAEKVEAGEDFSELKSNLKKKTNELSKEFSKVRNEKHVPLTSFFKSGDTNLTYNNNRKSTSTVENTRLESPDYTKINQAGNAIVTLSLPYNENKEVTEAPEGADEKNKLAVKFLAGTRARAEELAKLVVEPVSQILVFKQLNKKHRNDPIGDVVKLINTIGIEKLEEALALIEKVGDLASISEINSIVPVLKGSMIPEKLSESKEQIALAFIRKKGASSDKEWQELLDIEGWEKENVLPLALAFDQNNGNATAAQWKAAAAKDPDLKTKPDQVRATARLEMFSKDDWYDKAKPGSGDKAKKKYTQLLYALLGEESLKKIPAFDVSAMRGDFLSMLIFFHKHIASFNASEGSGFDRQSIKPGAYARSSKDHPIHEQYKGMLGDAGGVINKNLLTPLNLSLLSLQGDSDKVGSKKLGGATYYSNISGGKFSTASAGLPSHNLRILDDLQKLAVHKPAIKNKLFGEPESGGAKISRSVDSDSGIMDALIEKQKAALSGKIEVGGGKTSFHDMLLTDRGGMVNALSTAINSITGGKNLLHAIGSEGHPSLILLVPKHIEQYKYNDALYDTTKAILPTLVNDFNTAPEQAIKMSERGSFGFQRPSAADTGDSIRIWPGYAPVEAILPGLKVIVEKIRVKKPVDDFANFDGLTGLTTDADKPILHIEALKTAMRHGFLALENKIDVSAPAPKKRVYEWLKTRLLIKLKQSELLLTKGSTLFAKDSMAEQSEKNKHYAITADMTDKIQEYAMLVAAASLNDTVNPNKDHLIPGKFKDDTDSFESMLAKKLNPADYRVFYLDSGEQALITAGILANRFQKGKDESDKVVAKSQYISHNPYFEVGVFGGDRRSNLERDDIGGTIVHADLSPVVTSGITAPKPKDEIHEGVKRTWQNEGGDVEKPDIIPIIDITNSTVDEVVSLGNMPNNFIIVESLTKHQQLGADKYIRGRLVAISNTAGTSDGPLDKTNFLDLAQKIVGPVANEGFNPLLARIRANMDKALYTKGL